MNQNKGDRKKFKDTSWDKVAGWYDDLLEKGEDTYQEKVILPNLLRLVNPQKGEKILDLACGQGFLSRALHEAGAEVVGVDISRELITRAKQQSPKEIDFKVSSAEIIPFADVSVGKISIVLALQNMENPQKVLTECARVLKADGELFVVLNHPVFRIPKKTSWGFDEKENAQYRRIDSYLSESRTEILMNPSKQDSEKTFSFHHPLQFYFKALEKAGFTVTRLEEWTSHKQSEAGPRAGAENRARKEIPMFLFLLAKKV